MRRKNAPSPSPTISALKKAPPLRLTERDLEIFILIYRYGFITVKQVDRWFFSGEDNQRPKRTTYTRISKWFHGGYVNKFTNLDDHRIPEPLLVLDEEGVKTVAESLEVEAEEIQVRTSPHAFRVPHDIQLHEVRYCLEQAVSQSEATSLENMHNQDVLEVMFNKHPIDYLDKRGKKQRMVVKPDLYFELCMGERRVRYLLELEMGSRNPERFVNEKIAPLLQLIISDIYRQKLGSSSGRVLVVFDVTQERLDNLRLAITKAGAARYFLVTRYEDLIASNPLESAIWWLPHVNSRVSLYQYSSQEFDTWLKDDIENKSLPTIKLLFK